MMPTLGLIATLATAAQAIMIPPNVALESLGNHGMGHLHFHDPHSKIMVVDCAGCAFAQPSTENGGRTWVQGVENRLYLNISVGARPETLELNGVQFYPPVMSLETEPPVPYIAQVPATASLVDIKSDPTKYTSNPLRLTSWLFQASSSQTVESGEEILNIRIQLSALESQPINVPEIIVHALKNMEGQLMLLKVETGMEGPQGTLEDCHEWPLLCKWRAVIASKFHGLKGGFKGRKGHGCHNGKGMMGGRPHHAINRPPPTNMHHGPNSHHDGAGPMDEHRGPPPSHHGKPHHHGHHNKAHRVLHVIGRLLVTVFVPIVLGVAAGMITYLLGMFLGFIVAFSWAKVRPVGRYQSVALAEEDIEAPRDSMDKTDYVDEKVDVEAPPQYAEVEGKEIK
ncbi:Phosphatidylinositol 4-kinase [Venturia nashicola]|nr:Phosphatidylinositol 4-kinase [Venturia nashicola]